LFLTRNEAFDALDKFASYQVMPADVAS
jgi:hypothetical protein